MIKVPFIVRYPNKVPAGRVSNAMQSLVDVAPTFLDMVNVAVPSSMTGVVQSEVWCGTKDSARDHIICENHHDPHSVHLKTYVNERYKLTVYYNKKYGEIYDLKSDPMEINNLWDNAEFSKLKSELLLKYVWAEMGKEPMWMPRLWHA